MERKIGILIVSVLVITMLSTVAIPIVKAATDPDLVAEQCKISQEGYSAQSLGIMQTLGFDSGDIYVVKAWIHNRGTTGCGTFETGFWLDNKNNYIGDYLHDSGLDGGAGEYAYSESFFATYGEHDIIVFPDCGEDVPESDEDNEETFTLIFD